MTLDETNYTKYSVSERIEQYRLLIHKGAFYICGNGSFKAKLANYSSDR
ncbi:hypothetical protein [Microcoleus sp. FACHB-831]|nr:hypothetical protein [Microcoleus sp. FACHB-831]